MNRIRYFAIFVLAAMGCAGGPCAYADAAPLRLTLDECIEIGLERSIPVANARRDVEIARAQIREVRALAHPILDLNANYTRLDDVPTIPDFPGELGRRNTYAAFADAEQLLYAGGSVRAALRIAEHVEDAAAREAERVESDVVRRITRSFYEVLYAQYALEVARESVRQLEAFEEQVRKRYNAQTASEFEWLSAQVALANERPSLIAADNARTLSRRAFSDLIHLDTNAFELHGELEIAPVVLDLGGLQRRAVRQRPEILQARAQRGVAQNQLRVTQADYLPEVRAFASYGGAEPSQRNPFGDGWEWEWLAGVRLTWSLFDGGRRRASVKADRLEIEKANDNLYDLERATRLEVERLWLALEEARETLRGTADNIDLAERALAIAGVRYEQGLATHLDFTDSNLALNNARLNHSRALLGYQHTLADLRHITGIRSLPDWED